MGQRSVASGMLCGLMGFACIVLVLLGAGSFHFSPVIELPLFFGGVSLIAGSVGLANGAGWARIVLIPGAVLIGLGTLPLALYSADVVAAVFVAYSIWLIVRCVSTLGPNASASTAHPQRD